MNLTQTAWTSWACKYQAANFMRVELFSRMGEGWLRFPVLPVLELLELRQKLYFRISVPGPSWNLDIQMCTKKRHVQTHSHPHKHLERGMVCVGTHKNLLKTHRWHFPLWIKWSQIPKHFHQGFSKFQNQTKQQSDLGETGEFITISSRFAWLC